MTSIPRGKQLNLIISSLLFCVVFIVLLTLFSRLKYIFPLKFERFTYGTMGTIAALLTTWLFLRFEKKSFGDIYLKWDSKTLKRFGVGFLIGLVISFAMILSLISLTSLKFEQNGNYNILSFLFWTLAFIPLAYMEELAFRAYPFINLQKATGVRLAQIIIAILFALYHFIGGQSLISSLIGPGTWSFVFGLAMLTSGGISLPTGLHYAANVVLAAVGQHRQFESIWTIQQSGIKPETQEYLNIIGNSIQVVLFLATIIVMEWWIRKKTKILV